MLILGLFSCITCIQCCFIQNFSSFSKNLRIYAITELYHEYISQHNINVLRREAFEEKDAFCKRLFVDGNSIDCDSFGNTQMQFTEGLIQAIILNRTFLLSSHIHENCFDNVIRHPWIADQVTVQYLADRANCSYAKNNIFDFSGAQIGYFLKRGNI